MDKTVVKPWYASQTVWGSLSAIAFGIGGAVYAYQQHDVPALDPVVHGLEIHVPDPRDLRRHVDRFTRSDRRPGRGGGDSEGTQS